MKHELTSEVRTGLSSVGPVTWFALLAPPGGRRRLTTLRVSHTRIMETNHQSAGGVPLAGLVSFSSEPTFLTVLVGLEAQGRSYGSRVCEKKRRSPCEEAQT